MNRLGLKISCFVVSVVIWMQVASTAEVAKTAQLAVNIEGLREGLTVAQVLTSKSDFQTRGHYLNMRGCIEALLGAGVVPIVNENDVVAITELMFTDNDELAGLLAGMVNADLLCLLSTVPGVYDGNPDDPATRLIRTWDDDRHQVEDVVQAGASALGRGGMHSKLGIARRTAQLGTAVVIADGREPDILLGISSGRSAGTHFPARAGASPAKRWLASADSHAAGSVTVNDGAAAALLDRSRLASLLPIGIEAIEGRFSQGDVIRIRSADGRVLGCGRAAYGHEEADREFTRARQLTDRRELRAEAEGGDARRDEREIQQHADHDGEQKPQHRAPERLPAHDEEEVPVLGVGRRQVRRRGHLVVRPVVRPDDEFPEREEQQDRRQGNRRGFQPLHAASSVASWRPCATSPRTARRALKSGSTP